MLKEAIEKIQQLCKPDIREIEGATFAIGTEGDAVQIRKAIDCPAEISLSSLDALVTLVQTEANPMCTCKPLYISAVGHDKVICFTRPLEELRLDRIRHYTVTAKDVPGWNEKVTLSFEEALIALRTRFQHTEDTEYALKLLSDITTGSKVTYNDNGVATSVVTRKGIDLQSNTAIRPIIRLRPYRTFQEIEQPESEFLIRVSERGITFVEADGGMWRLKARSSIKAYLDEKLAELIHEGTVAITL